MELKPKYLPQPTTAFSGKHVRGNSKKLLRLKRRERRLRSIGLSVMSFIQPMNWIGYFANRKEANDIARKKAAKQAKA